MIIDKCAILWAVIHQDKWETFEKQCTIIGINCAWKRAKSVVGRKINRGWPVIDVIILDHNSLYSTVI